MRYLALVLFAFFSLEANAQEEVDSSTWELVIPIEIADVKPQMGTITNLSRKEFLTYPASFDDPSRLLTKFPGFSNSNDQNNSIVFHGMPGWMSGWTLYDSEILSPNHLASAGTYTDRNDPSSGGVNAFSGQIIGEYSYRANPDIHTSNDYFAGVSNLTLRTPYKNQITINTSLIGIESGIDLKTKKFEFLLNGRYSTVGILNSLGIDFGDEKINYQDVVSQLSFDLFKGKVKIYGLSGKSSNNKERAEVIENYEDAVFKAQESKIIILGANYSREFENGLLESTTNYSYQDLSNYYSSVANEYLIDTKNRMLSHNSSYTKYSDKVDVEFNLRYKSHEDHNHSIRLIQPGIFLHFQYSRRLYFDLGFKTAFYDDANILFQPSAGITWISSNFGNKLNFKYSRNNQIGRQPMLPVADSNNTHGNNFILSYQNVNKNFEASLFYHHFGDVLQDPSLPFRYSYFDDYDRISDITFGDYHIGKANIFGASVGIHQEFNDLTKLSMNFTVMRGTQTFISNIFTPLPTIETNVHLPYDVNFMSNFILTKKSFLLENLDVSLSSTIREGKNEKELQNSSVPFSFSDQYSIKLPDYIRIDTRLNYHFKNSKYSSMLSLDIQNITNRKNVSHHYYDAYINEKTKRYNLGILPILSWRVVI